MDKEQQDPYKVLGVSYSATQEEIQKAFQNKLKESPSSKEVIHAYGSIRDAHGREQFLWGNVCSCLALTHNDKEQRALDIPALIRELAFLSSWELGGDQCLKK